MHSTKASPVQGEVSKIYLIFDGGVVKIQDYRIFSFAIPQSRLTASQLPLHKGALGATAPEGFLTRSGEGHRPSPVKLYCHSGLAEESVPLPVMRMTAFTPVLRRRYDPPEDPVRKYPRCKLPRRSNYLARNRRNSCPSPHNTCRWDQYSCAHFLHRGKA